MSEYIELDDYQPLDARVGFHMNELQNDIVIRLPDYRNGTKGVPSQVKERIMQILNGKYIKAQEIAKMIGKSSERTGTYLSIMVEKGELKKVKLTRSSATYYFTRK